MEIFQNHSVSTTIAKPLQITNGENEHTNYNTNISSKRRRRMQFRIDGSLQLYQTSMKNILVTTRFNNETWAENTRYRMNNTRMGCIYPTSQENSAQIAIDAIVFVLEMNNDTNRIMGMGMVRNHALIKKHRVYSNENYNLYAYLGKHRIDRSEMDEKEEQIMKVFDILCFTGARHMKRLQGMKMFPVDMLYWCSKILDLVDFITQMFKRRLERAGETP